MSRRIEDWGPTPADARGRPLPRAQSHGGCIPHTATRGSPLPMTVGVAGPGRPPMPMAAHAPTMPA